MTHQTSLALPQGLRVLERGWLSSNNVLIQGATQCALIDTGYCSHAEQTLALVGAALGSRSLDLLVNTHLHSDHCGGNAAFQAAYPGVQTHIPPGQAAFVRDWDPDALTYAPTGQLCPQFRYEHCLQPGQEITLGDALWQVHAAPGHDPHSVILFEPVSRTLVSADALWERGFGVVFPELDGLDAFDAVARTLDLIECLCPALVIPGHGALFTDVAQAMAFARQRLDGFVRNPAKHRLHAAKVLVKFKLLDLQRVELDALVAWAQSTPYLQRLMRQQFGTTDVAEVVRALVQELVRAGAARVQDRQIFDC
ncbi:MAG: MBL fold metallo-hydrolase [Rhodoferax sp.]